MVEGPPFPELAAGMVQAAPEQVPLFEAALSMTNDEVKQLLGQTMGNDIEAFLGSQYERIRADATALDVSDLDRVEPAGGGAVSATARSAEMAAQRMKIHACLRIRAFLTLRLRA